jgi:putative ABC transport system permease protein
VTALAVEAVGHVGWGGLAASLVLIVVAVALSVAQGLGLERSMIWASTRALVQLLAVGSVLGYLLDPQRPVLLASTWTVLMVVVAAATVRNRAPEVPGIFWLALSSVGIATAVGLFVLLGLGIFPLEGRTMVPLSGMIVGNALAATVVASRRIVGELGDKRAEVEARLALGLSSADAAKPHVRAALRTALIPQIESTKAVGLVALPGAMTGLILAGVDPVDAVKVQAAVMFLILGGVATAVTVLSIGLTRRLFTPDHRLRPLARTAG